MAIEIHGAHLFNHTWPWEDRSWVDDQLRALSLHNLSNITLSSPFARFGGSLAMSIRHLVVISLPVAPSRYTCTHESHTSLRASCAVSNLSRTQLSRKFSLSSIATLSGHVSQGLDLRDGNRPCKGARNVVSYGEGTRSKWRAQATSGTAQSKDVVVETVGFNDGSATRFSPLINGCWTLAGGHGRIVESEILQVMEMYARSGLTSFDTADIYGSSESILGAFREQWLKAKEQNDDLRDVQIFTKFCPNIFRMKMTPQVVEQSIRRSMAALRVPRLDLVQMHWWDYDMPGMVDVAKSLADLREKGLITSIGVTNMSTEALAQISDAGVPVVCNQVQFSLLDQRPRMAMLKFCAERDIKLFTYGTLAGGLLSNRYFEEGKKGFFGKVSHRTPDLNTSSLKMYWRIVREAGGEDYWRKLLSTLGEIAASKQVSIAAVALKWAMQQGPVHPIIGLRNATHLDDNLTALTFSIEPTEMNQIEEVLKTSRGPRGDCYEMERS